MSTRYNTGNPIESTDVRDMSDNAKNFDEFSNSMSDSFTDRFGVDRQTMEGAVRKAGFRPASFDFLTGGSLVSGDRNKAVFNPAPPGDNNWYAWQGAFPKIISPNSTPSTSGGLGDNAWKPVTNNILAPTVMESIRRSYAEAGYNLVAGSFEAGGTLVNANDVLLHEASGKAYYGAGPFPQNVPAGTNPTSGGFTVVEIVLSAVPSYAVLRAYAGKAKSIYVTGVVGVAKPEGISGNFALDSSDTTSADNGGTIIVDVLGRRWKRVYSSAISPSWFGAKGDGVADDNIAIQKALDSSVGKSVMFSGDATYLISSITVPPKVNLITGGCTFRRTTGTGYVLILLGSNIVDSINISDIGGPSNKGVSVAGSHVQIGSVLVKSDTVDSLYGVHIEGASRISDININYVLTLNYKSAVQTFNIIASKIGTVVMNNIVTGLYLRDVKNTRFEAVYSASMSPSSTGGPGENGVLLESTLGAFATYGVSFGKVAVEDTSEHGVRLGGSLPMRDIHFDSITTSRTGAAEGTGGAGFKVLGYESSPGVYQTHENISVGKLTVTDVSVLGSGVNNFSGAILVNVKNVFIGSFTLRKRNAPYSARHGLLIANCQGGSINGVDMSNVQGTPVYVTVESTVPANEKVKDISINGVVGTDSTTNPVLYFQDAALTVDGFVFSGEFRGGGMAIRSDAATGSAYRKGVRITALYTEPRNITAGPPLQCNNYPEEIIVDFTSKFYGTYGSGCCDGSIFRDPSGGASAIRIRKGGAWVIS